MLKYISIIVLNLAAIHGSSQDLNFSQFYEQPILRNPALCGLYKGNLRVQGIYRDQWPALRIPYHTSGLSVEARFPGCSESTEYDNYWIGGLQFTHDVAGDSRLTRSQVMLSAGRHFNLDADERSLIVSFVPSIVNTNFDSQRLRWDDEYINGLYVPNSTRQIINNSSITYGELGAGVVFTSPVTDDISYEPGAS